MVDSIKEEFLEEQREFAADFFEASQDKIFKSFEQQKAEICHDFTHAMEQLFEKYQVLHENGVVEKPKYLHISFLRTGILNQTSPYRIDLYDIQWVTSPIECSVEWNPDFVYKHLYELKKLLVERFAKQSRVKPYEIDSILLEVSLAYHILLVVLLKDILQEHFQGGANVKQYQKNAMSFFIGEFLDHFEPLVRWEEA